MGAIPVTALWIVFAVLLPFREGSGSPEGILAAHLTFLAAACVSALNPRRLARGFFLASLAALAVAALSGAMGGYRFASLLALTDLGVVLGTLVLAEKDLRGGAGRGGPLLAAVALSGLAQALFIVGKAVASGLGERSPGSLLNSDHAAAYLCLCFWALMALEAPGFAAWAKNLAGAVLLAAAALQASRGALIALAVSGGLYLAMRWSAMSRRGRQIAVATSIVALVFGTVAVAHRISSTDDPYRWERLKLWAVSLRLAADNPLIGVGPGVFEYRTAPHRIEHADAVVRFSKDIEAEHSDYLKVAAETGLLGAIAFAALLILVIGRGLAAIRAGGGREAALGAGVAGLLTHMTVENLSARPAVSCTGALIVAALLSGGQREAGKDAGPDDPGARQGAWATRLVLAWGGAGAAALVLIVAPYMGYRDFQLSLAGGPQAAGRLSSAIFWSPFHPRYRAAFAGAVEARERPTPLHLRTAMLAVDDAIALKPVDPDLYLLKARLARKALSTARGDAIPGAWAAMSEECYARAVNLDPRRPWARIERGWLLLASGRAADARADAEAALALEPNCFDARRLRAAALIEMNDPRGARAELREAERRRKALVDYRPINEYEGAVLRWDETGWREVEDRLRREGA